MHGCCGGLASRFKGIIIAVGVLLSLFLLAKALHEFKLWSVEGKNVYPSNVITVSGEGKVNKIPNIASFSYSVVEDAATVAEAQGDATKKGNKVIEFLKANGIEDKDIKTSSYTINPKYDFEQSPCTAFSCPPAKRVLKGYEVSQAVTVKVRKTEDAGKILGGIGSLEVSNVSGLDFTVDDEENLKTEARKAAINDAKAKAETLSKELGVKIVRLVNFYEENNLYPPIPYFAAKEGFGGDMRSVAQSAPSIPAGETETVVRVSVTYEIR